MRLRRKKKDKQKETDFLGRYLYIYITLFQGSRFTEIDAGISNQIEHFSSVLRLFLSLSFTCLVLPETLLTR